MPNFFAWFTKRFDKKDQRVPASLQQLPAEIARFLIGKLDLHPSNQSARDSIAHFEKLTTARQHAEIGTLYFVLEHFICEPHSDPLLAKVRLRKEVRTRFASIAKLPDFYLIFEPEEVQIRVLCRDFLISACNKAIAFLGAIKGNFLIDLKKTLIDFPESRAELIQVIAFQQQGLEQQTDLRLLEQISAYLYEQLDQIVGPSTVRSIYQRCFDELSESYLELESFPVILQLMPYNILDQSKINLLSRERNRQLFQEKIAALDASNRELTLKNAELQRFQIALEESKKEAEKSARIKEQFLANMSHEIRTPLNAISGFLHLLLEDEHSAQQMQYLQGIQNSTTGLMAIVNDILDLSKFEAGKIPIEAIQFELEDLLQKMYQSFFLESQEKNLQLKFEFNELIPNQLIGDPHRLNQILYNLLSNAFKFTSSGHITLLVNKLSESPEQIQVQFAVEDTGIGIPADKVDHIFESFNQVRPSINREYGGTGLGLTIGKNLAEAMGGSIEVESTEGKGSTFYVSLPFKILSPKESDQKKTGTSTEEPDRPLNILVAEDNVVNQMIIRKMLEKWKGADRVTIANNGIEALEKLQEADFDIVLMDVQMPRMDGLEATMCIRTLEDENLAQIPILGVTAHALKEEIQRCLDAGMNGCMTKPFVPRELFKTITLLTNYEQIESSNKSKN